MSRYGCGRSRPRAARRARPPRDADGRRPAPPCEPARAEPTPDPTRRDAWRRRCSIAAVAASSPTRGSPDAAGRARRPGRAARRAGRRARASSAAAANRCAMTTQCATTYQWLPEVLRALREREPGAEVRIETVPDAETIPALLDARIDVALVNKLDRQADRVRLQHLFDDELRAVVSSSHPWAGRAHVAAADFVDVHLALCESYDQNRVPPVPLPVPIGAQPQRLTTLPLTADLLIEMVASGGDVVTILPSWIVAPYLQTHDLASVQVGVTPQARTWYCATRHGPPAGEHRSLRLGTDRTPRHAAARPESRSAGERRAHPGLAGPLGGPGWHVSGGSDPAPRAPNGGVAMRERLRGEEHPMFTVHRASTGADWREATALLYDYVEWVRGWTDIDPLASNRNCNGTGPSGRPLRHRRRGALPRRLAGDHGRCRRDPRPARRKRRTEADVRATSCTWSRRRRSTDRRRGRWCDRAAVPHRLARDPPWCHGPGDRGVPAQRLRRVLHAADHAEHGRRHRHGARPQRGEPMCVIRQPDESETGSRSAGDAPFPAGKRVVLSSRGKPRIRPGRRGRQCDAPPLYEIVY